MKQSDFFPSISISIALLLLVLFSGCAQVNNQAKVSLADIQILEIRALETAFLIELRIMNATESPFLVKGIECDLDVDGNNFASGVAGEQHEIPAYGSAIIPVTVYASALDVVPSVIRIIQSNKSQQQPLRYELSGHIRLGSNNSLRKTLPFQSKGELSFAGLR